jgi:O-antigen/teichoic acid export membrane protein
VANSLIKDSLIYGIFDFLSKGVAAIIFPFFTYHLSVSDFGMLSLITVITSLLGMLIELGINNAVQLLYYENRFANQQYKVVSNAMFVQLACGVVFTILAFFVGYSCRHWVYDAYKIEWRFLYLSLFSILPSQIIRYCLNINRLHNQPIIFGIVSFCTNLLWMFLAWWLLTKGYGIAGYLASNLLLLLIILPFSIGSIRQDLKLQWDKTAMLEIVKLGYPFIFSNIGFWVFASLDRILLSKYSSIAEVGLYSIAYKVVVVVVIVNAAFGQAWSPFMLKKLNDANFKNDFSFIHQISKSFHSMGALMCIFLALFSQEIMKIISPPSYHTAAASIGILAWALFFNAMSQFTLIGISLTKKTKYINYCSWIAVISNIVFCLLLVKKYGSLGVSFSLLITYLVVNIFYYYYSVKNYPYQYSFQPVIWLSILIAIANLCSGNYFFSVSIILKIIIFLASIGILYYYNKDSIAQNIAMLLPKKRNKS